MSKFETKKLFSFPEMIDKVQSLLHNIPGNELAQLHSKLSPNFFEHLIYKENGVFELTTFDQPLKGESDHIVINGYYELYDGTIVSICRADSLRRKVDYATDYGSGYQQATYEEVKSWKKRNDLRDYPNSSNPKLPYEFDLNWDIKHESELKEMIDAYNFNWLENDGVIAVLKKYPKLANKFIDITI